MDRSHVTQALEREIASPEKPKSPPLAADMAFGAGSAVLFMYGGMLAPFVGSIAAASVIPVLSRLRYEAPPKGLCPHVKEAVEAELASRVLPSAAENATAVRAWSDWLPWNSLAVGEKVEVPAELPHPRDAGFNYTRMASNIGQVNDWVKSLPDGSRLHVHEYGDGRLVVHQDALDPSRGPATATLHWLTEAPEGNLMAALGAVGLAVLAWKMVED